MARPGKTRFICRMPWHCYFTAKGGPVNGINLTVEEYEVIRLIDYTGMNQTQCAAQMNVSRATVQALYTEARKKLARFLVEGTFMEIHGGNYQLCQEQDCQLTCPRNLGKSMANNNKKGDITMKIAVTYENGQIFQHFGHTEQFKVYVVEDGKIVSSEIVDTNGQGHGALAEAGIQLYPGAMGDANAQVESFLAGTLSYDPDTMCSHHEHSEGHDCGSHGCGSNGYH